MCHSKITAKMAFEKKITPQICQNKTYIATIIYILTLKLSQKKRKRSIYFERMSVILWYQLVK